MTGHGKRVPPIASRNDGAAPTLALIVALAAALRLFGLADESLWLDEAHTVWRISLGFWQMMPGGAEGAQGPLYFTLLKAWCMIFGTSEAALRLPSAICGVLTVPVVCGVGRRWFGDATGTITALLLATNPFAIHYSQEARPYALFLLLGSASFALLARLLEKPTRRDLILFAICTECALYTHAFGVFLVVAHVAIYSVRRRLGALSAAAPRPARFGALLAGILVVALPAAILFGMQYERMVNGTFGLWIPNATVLFLGKAVYSYFLWPWLAVAAVAVVLLVLPFSLVRDARLRAPAATAAAVCASLILLPWLVSKLGPEIFYPRYTIPGLAALLMLVGASIAELHGGRRTAVLGVLLALTCVPLVRYYTMVDKDPWRQSAEVIDAASRTGDVVVAMPFWTARPLGYYLPSSDHARLVAPRRGAEIDSLIAGATRVWLVESYPGEPHLAGRLAERLAADYVRADSIVVNDRLAVNPDALQIARIRVSLYTPKPSRSQQEARL